MLGGGLSLGFALALGAEIEGIDIDGGAVAAHNLNLSRFGCRARGAGGHSPDEGGSAASRFVSSTSWLLPQPPFSGAGEGA